MVIDHPDWVLSLSFDMFGSHMNMTEALDIFEKHKIQIIKVEAATSHINQILHIGTSLHVWRNRIAIPQLYKSVHTA